MATLRSHDLLFTGSSPNRHSERREDPGDEFEVTLLPLKRHLLLFKGMDQTLQRGDLKPYGALIKLVPAHWGKGKDLDKNTRSCWYRPGFRWSPERAQSVLPKNLKGFEVRSSLNSPISHVVIVEWFSIECRIRVWFGSALLPISFPEPAIALVSRDDAS